MDVEEDQTQAIAQAILALVLTYHTLLQVLETAEILAKDAETTSVSRLCINVFLLAELLRCESFGARPNIRKTANSH